MKKLNVYQTKKGGKNMQKLRIELREDTNDELYDLLLLADPSKDIVDEYLERGECYTAWADD